MSIKAYLLTDELAKRRCIRALEKAALRDAAGQPLLVRVRRKPRRRSLATNRLMWAWTSIVARHVGCEPEEMHEDFKAVLCESLEHVNHLTGEVRNVSRGTSTFTTIEMANYLDRLERLVLATYNISLPPADHPEAWEAAEEIEDAMMRRNRAA